MNEKSTKEKQVNKKHDSVGSSEATKGRANHNGNASSGGQTSLDLPPSSPKAKVAENYFKPESRRGGMKNGSFTKQKKEEYADEYSYRPPYHSRHRERPPRHQFVPPRGHNYSQPGLKPEAPKLGLSCYHSK